MQPNSQTLSSVMKKLGRFGGFWHAMVHYHCLLPSFPKSLILKELNWWLGSLGEKEMREKKSKAACCQVSAWHLQVVQQVRVQPWLHWCKQQCQDPGAVMIPGESPEHTQQCVEHCLLQRAMLSSPKNLEPFSLELLILLTPRNLQKWHSPKISQMLNV